MKIVPLVLLLLVPGYMADDGEAFAIAEANARRFAAAASAIHRMLHGWIARLPEGFDWVESEMRVLESAKQPSGLVEHWYGDGNFCRTQRMFAFMKSQGIRPESWVRDLGIGAVRDGARALFMVDATGQARGWAGNVRFDTPRYQRIWDFAQNYARLNEFPEHFTVEESRIYRLRSAGGEERIYLGAKLAEGVPLRAGRWILEPVPGPPYPDTTAAPADGRKN